MTFSRQELSSPDRGAHLDSGSRERDSAQAWRARCLAAEQEVAQLQAAMKSRAVIEQAKGVLVAWTQGSVDDSFATLVGLSQHCNVKLRDVAALVVALGEGNPAPAVLERHPYLLAALQARVGRQRPAPMPQPRHRGGGSHQIGSVDQERDTG